jgi:hypothetical protein
MTYRIEAQGYGGGGASIRPIIVDSIVKAKEEMQDLLACDHAVQLYKMQEDGSKKYMQFEHYATYHVTILDD